MSWQEAFYPLRYLFLGMIVYALALLLAAWASRVRRLARLWACDEALKRQRRPRIVFIRSEELVGAPKRAAVPIEAMGRPAGDPLAEAQLDALHAELKIRRN